jgi:uroporphyrin-III C-methyltransferase/precorrin-2 dehydrogenase/sirohydrochlorin ferrochelatase
MYPVALSVKNRKCLVVGGGWVALRKVEGLLVDEAIVTVVAPDFVEPLEGLGKRDDVLLERRGYRAGEAAAYALAFAATDDREVNRRVSEDAGAAGVWVNVADDPELCSFHLPARIRRGALQVFVASAGAAPFVVRRLRAFLERRFGPEWAAWVEAAGRFRAAVRSLGLSRDEAERRYDQFFDATVDTSEIRARTPTAAELSGWLQPDAAAAAEPSEGRAAARKAIPSPAPGRSPARQPGLVSLVGGGPGDAGLLTVRGRQRLLAADAVVYDRLAATALPCELPRETELHCVGKEAGHHPVAQEEINALIVRLALEGKRVVRLKGGDPFVFGRGGEEAEALIAEGIPFEIVPGVAAAMGVAAYAGIPLTHRFEAVRVTLLTAHEAIKNVGTQVCWDQLAADPHATLVGYMGVSCLPAVVERLLAGGMDRDTPAAIVERGTTSCQRSVRSTLALLAEDALRARIKPPALFVIGPVVRRAEALDWFATRPLFGQRIVALAPAGEEVRALESAGAEMIVAPIPLSPAARVVLHALPISGCLLRDDEEVETLDEERDGAGWDSARTVAWCLSATAAARATALGWRNVREVVRPDRPEAWVQMLLSGGAAP